MIFSDLLRVPSALFVSCEDVPAQHLRSPEGSSAAQSDGTVARGLSGTGNPLQIDYSTSRQLTKPLASVKNNLGKIPFPKPGFP